jgi:hypothetical protein
MKNAYFTFIAVLLLGKLAVGQNAFEDAKRLATIYKSYQQSFVPLAMEEVPDSTLLHLGQFLTILDRHYDRTWGPIADPSMNTILAAYRSDNPFFNRYKFPEGINLEAKDAALKMAESASLKRVDVGGLAAGATGGINVAMIADGVARFLVKRTKEELTVAFFEDFRDAINQNAYLKDLFPTTHLTLLGIGDQVYNFNAYLGSMRESFLADLKRLHYTLETFLTETQKDLLIKGIPADYIADLFKSARMLLEKTSVRDIIIYLGKDANFQIYLTQEEIEGIQKVRAALRLLFVVSEGLANLSMQEKSQWVTPQRFRLMLKDPVTLDFFLGLLYERSKNIGFGTQKVADNFNNSNARQFLTVLNSFVELGENLRNIQVRIEEGDYNVEDSIAYFQYFDYTQAGLDLLNTARQFGSVVFPKDSTVAKEMENALFILGRVNAITLDVRRRHYSTAVIQTGLLIGHLLEDKAAELSCQLLRYGAFMAAIAECESSSEVEAVMESFALPRGSAYIKKHSAFNLAIGSYVGINTGVEWLENAGTSNKSGLNAGIGAPIGIALSWGSQKKEVAPGALSLYLNVVDLGAFTAFRFTNNDDIQTLPSLKFSNLFAPGGALIYGLPKFPGAFGLFAQRGPSVRKVTVNAIEIDSPAWRLGVFAAVDIPLFNLYTTGKKSGCGYVRE